MLQHATHYKKIALSLIMLVLLFAGLGARPNSALAAGCSQTYTVKQGEYLSLIAKRYGLSWRALAEINNIKSPWVIYTGQKLCISEEGTITPTPQPGTIPTFSIVSVEKDKSVTIRTRDFPAKDSFDVLMGPFGTKGINGRLVDTIDSGKGGSFTANFKIPAFLRGSRQIAIRLESNTGSGFFAYNWFYNNTTGSGSGSMPSGYTGFPTLSITSVVRNKTVTIKTNNLPPDDKFDVYMGAMGTKGVNGIKVDTTSSGKGGSQTLTYTIPGALKASYQIAIRMQSPASGYFAYNWFYNNTTQ
ncbi:MAG TPA: LysM domain-containing protein [Anaerolineales bacterium]|jgi:LysM repeat protein|nr:LysM domain-containing protein [Anaerolineales bacterium]